MACNSELEILFENEALVAIDKPWGFHVHPPENDSAFVPRKKILLYKVRKYLNAYAYPVHRLDVATKGVLIYAKNPEAAGVLSAQIRAGIWQKTYLAVVRGFIDQEQNIEIPLESDSSGEFLAAQTIITPLKQIELPYSVGKKFSSARYTLVKANPVTGRFHQIRRHLNRVSHPIIGDAAHGDSYHNRFFKTQLRINGLCLWAYNLKFYSPEQISVTSSFDEKWSRILELFECSRSTVDNFLVPNTQPLDTRNLESKKAFLNQVEKTESVFE